MGIDRLATGDNWYEPYVSGRDVLYERIIEDYERSPGWYEDWEKVILDRDSRYLSPEEQKELLDYMENWISAEEEHELW